MFRTFIIIVAVVSVAAAIWCLISFKSEADPVPASQEAAVSKAPAVPSPVDIVGAGDMSAPPSAGGSDAVAVPNPAGGRSFSPLADAAARITKKPFGLEVGPKNSPVSPERFSGFHTGVDLEIFPGEQDADVAVYAVCAGKLVLKRTASGYGGVAAQACRIDGRDVVVVYGHLDLASVTWRVGDTLAVGGRLGLLGRGFSPETDGERKHLHLSIHLGADINIKGYVQRRSELGQWLDPAALFAAGDAGDSAGE